VLPDELEALPGVLEQSGFPVSGLLVTHGDWDHLLARHAFPGASLGCGERTAELLEEHPELPQRELDQFDDEHYIAGRPSISLDGIQRLPAPGRLDCGSDELELHPAVGHTADGTAYYMPSLGVLVVGDYLSPVEIPWISPGGSVGAYLETLGRLRGLVARANRIVPGHGEPLERDRAMRILEEDISYLTALRADWEAAQLPAGRNTAAQRKIHAQNLERRSS
jgi:glyoxylase-like metal-dependent hydrolase (beta-lactamase superfamily II)